MRPPIDGQLLAAVLGCYPIAEPYVLDEFESGKRNDSFLVQDGAGSRFILRRYRRNPDQARIVFQLRFQQALRGIGYPTAEVIESAGGQLLVTEEGSPWVLFEHIVGNQLDFDRMGQIEEAGRRLAEFHARTEAVHLEAVEIDINRSPRRWWTHGDQDLGEIETLFRELDTGDELAYLRAWHDRLLREWPLARLDTLATGWVHGDYHGRNVLFVGDKMTGLFDFDVLGRRIFGADLAKGLFTFGRQSRLSRHIRPDAARRFLVEYARIRPLPPDEVYALPMLSALIWAPHAPYYPMIRRDGEDPVLYFRHHVENMRELSAEMERLLPSLDLGR